MREGFARGVVMTTKPRRKSIHPVSMESFWVRVDGTDMHAAAEEESGWHFFLSECRGGRRVELLRGETVIARLEPQKAKPL
jgi:hypothetical protein